MASKSYAPHSRYSLPVFLISVVLLALQVALMQLLAYTQGNHLAYIVLSIALLGFGSGGSVLTLISRRGAGSLKKYFRGLSAVLVAVTLWMSPEIHRSPYKPLSYALQLPEVAHQGPLPHPLGRVDRVSSPALRHAPDLSLPYTGPVPAPPQLFVNGETAGVLLHPDDVAASILLQTPQALPYVAGNPERVLFLSPGGTVPLLASGGTQLTIVEHHPHLVRALRDLSESLPVKVVRQDPRLFLSRDHLPPQDLIVFPERGQFGGPTGRQTFLRC